MKSFLRWFLFVLLCYVVQSSVMPRWAVNGVAPDLLLLITVSVAFLRGQQQGALMGFLTGLLEDAVTGTFWGLNILCHLLTGYICGRFSERIFRDQFSVPVLSALIVIPANYLLSAGIMLLLGYRFSLLNNAEYTLLPMLIYNLVFALPMHWLVYRLDSYELE